MIAASEVPSSATTVNMLENPPNRTQHPTSRSFPVGERKEIVLNSNKNTNNTSDKEVDALSLRLFQEALEAERAEPELATILRRTVLAPHVRTFEDAVACTVSYRLLGIPCSDVKSGGANNSNLLPQSQPMFCPNSCRAILTSALESDELELGHTMSEAVREDALAVCARDPACETLLEAILFYKGYAALVCHRAARRRWTSNSSNNKRSFVSLFLQSQASAVFGLDIHPACSIGSGVLFDHGTGLVIGETAVVGDGCTFLHGVTLGGTGKESGDRHPKIGKNVLIGAGASVLGNVRVGDGAKIGAGSIVLRPIPSGATAVGAPAKIIGRAKEEKPGSTVDELLQDVSPFHKEKHEKKLANEHMIRVDSVETTATTASETSDSDLSSNGTPGRSGGDCICPFRDIRRLGHDNAPRGSLTFCKLVKSLSPAGCTRSEIGELFFAMDIDLVGYVSMEVFHEKCAELVTRYTRIDASLAEELVTAYMKKED